MVRPSSGLNTTKDNLPPQLTTFVGRAAEVAELTRLLADPACRLLTLVGVGGIGKTRLALQVAGQMAAHFARRVCFVPLQPIHSTEFLISALADALGFPLTGQAAPQVQLLNYLRDQELLLVLDNFEQLLSQPDEDTSGGEVLLTLILETAPAVKLLVTSREVLNLQEEWLYPVQGLSYPEPLLQQSEESTYDAVQLFAERARQVRRDFSLADEQASVVRICQLVEGAPLALVLAASWVKTLSCAVIADEIQQNLDFLTTRLRNVPDRQRSMRAVFEYSWQRLSEQEQSVFKRLSVFRGNFRREAAERVARASLITLTALADKSLLRWQPDGCYQMHELLRQYAAEQLVQSPQDIAQIYDWHCAYYADFLQRQYSDMMSGQQHQALAEIKIELENIRAAWHWAVELAKTTEIEKLADALFVFYQFQSRYLEGLNTFEKVSRRLDTPETGPQQEALLAKILVYTAWLCIRLGRFEPARAALERSQLLYARHNVPPASGAATDPLIVLATLALIRGDYVEAARLGQEACRLNRAHHSRWNLTFSYYILANAGLAQGQYEVAGRYARQAYKRAVTDNDRWFSAYLLVILGDIARAQGDYAQAQQHYQASYSLRSEFDDAEGMAVAHNRLGQAALLEGNYTQAHQLHQQSLAIYQQINDRGGLATSLNGLGAAACALGDYDAARQYFQQALQIANEIQFMPLVGQILARIGQLLLHVGKRKQGAAVLAFVQRHSASQHETKAQAQHFLARHGMNPDSTIEAGTASTLEAVIELVRNELAALGKDDGEESFRHPRPSDGHSLNPQPLVEPLTARELEILRLIAAGHSNPEIAAALILTVGTVKAHTHHIYGKLNAANRTQAVARAREMGLLP